MLKLGMHKANPPENVMHNNHELKIIRFVVRGIPLCTRKTGNMEDQLLLKPRVVYAKEAFYTRRETAVCICLSSGGGSFEYIT